MPKENPKPVWNVYIEDYNRREIKVFNVFNHYTFFENCKKEFRRYSRHKDIEKLEHEIKGWAMYCFWSKCEYEIVLTSWPEKKDFKDMKIDIYDQLNLNWDSFFKYVMEHKADFLRKE